MPPRVKVVLNSPGVEQLLKDPGVLADLQRRGRAVAAVARATAPVDSGDYADSIEVSSDETDRAAVRIGASVDYALVVESRTGNLARALDAGRLA
ncbi:MAG: HK97 gp10 family phage protein [Candidatus Nanopelagicales bacterium]|jgi:hypothetical protein